MGTAIRLKALDSFECGVVGTISHRQEFEAGPIEAQELVDAGLAERLPDQGATTPLPVAEAGTGEPIDVIAHEVLALETDGPATVPTPLLSPVAAARRGRPPKQAAD